VLLDAVKQLDIKALWIPDRKRILIDRDLPTAKQGWGEAHEVGHSILPWHNLALHGDKKQTLSPTCEFQVESDANFTAGRCAFSLKGEMRHLGNAPPLPTNHLERGIASATRLPVWTTCHDE
jgi:hypothetical protein